MQMNGGYFGSMLPFAASSFAPPMAGNLAGIGGVGGTPDQSGLTTPPTSPNITSLLAALSKLSPSGFGASGPANSALPPNSFSPFMANGGQPPQQQQGQPGGAPSNPLGAINPQMIQQLLQKLSMSGGMP